SGFHPHLYVPPWNNSDDETQNRNATRRTLGSPRELPGTYIELFLFEPHRQGGLLRARPFLRVLIGEPADAVLRLLHKLPADLLDQLPAVLLADFLEFLLLVRIEQGCDL